MRRAIVLLSLLCVVAAPVAACGDTGDSKLSNGQDLPPNANFDGSGPDGTVGGGTEDGSAGPEDSGSVGDPDTGTVETDAGTKKKDSGSVSMDSGSD